MDDEERCESAVAEPQRPTAATSSRQSNNITALPKMNVTFPFTKNTKGTKNKQTHFDLQH